MRKTTWTKTCFFSIAYLLIFPRPVKAEILNYSCIQNNLVRHESEFLIDTEKKSVKAYYPRLGEARTYELIFFSPSRFVWGEKGSAEFSPENHFSSIGEIDRRTSKYKWTIESWRYGEHKKEEGFGICRRLN